MSHAEWVIEVMRGRQSASYYPRAHMMHACREWKQGAVARVMAAGM